jgi:hypothetical protein
MKLTIYGDEKMHKFLAELVPNTFDEIDKTEGEFIAFIQKSAKLRAPRLTGALAQSIEKKQNKKGEWRLDVFSPYGWFQEHGFVAKEFQINPAMPTRAGVGGGPFIGDIYGNFGKGTPKKSTPFVAPATEKGLNMLPAMLKEAAFKGANNSKQ